MDKDFREGDNVFIGENDELFGGSAIFIRHSNYGKVVVEWQGSGGENQGEVDFSSLYHDPNRLISAAVQKAIEDNEEKPKGMVKKYFNVSYIDKDLLVGKLWETKTAAENQTVTKEPCFIKTVEIEVPE